MIQSVESDFVGAIRPVLGSGDYSLIAKELRKWPVADLIELLYSDDAEVVRLAVICLGHLAAPKAVYPLVSCLGHEDVAVVSAAEDALWSVWMRSAGATATDRLHAAVELIQAEKYDDAIWALRAIVAGNPTFAEAFHQLGIAWHSLENLDQAEEAYAEALRLNPCHYAAAAALGHICVERGDLDAALRRYHTALHIHPRMSDLRAIVPRLEAALAQRVVA